MTTPYISPEHASALQVQDSAILREIQLFREDAVKRFDSVDKRIDKVEEKFEQVVTRAEFGAVIGRVDSRVDAVEANVNRGLDGIRNDMQQGFDEVKEGGKARTNKNRWLMGAALTCAGVISAVTFGVLNLTIN